MAAAPLCLNLAPPRSPAPPRFLHSPTPLLPSLGAYRDPGLQSVEVQTHKLPTGLPAPLRLSVHRCSSPPGVHEMADQRRPLALTYRPSAASRDREPRPMRGGGGRDVAATSAAGAAAAGSARGSFRQVGGAEACARPGVSGALRGLTVAAGRSPGGLPGCGRTPAPSPLIADTGRRLRVGAALTPSLAVALTDPVEHRAAAARVLVFPPRPSLGPGRGGHLAGTGRGSCGRRWSLHSRSIAGGHLGHRRRGRQGRREGRTPGQTL